ncbi:MAG: fumarylacetoacetate hydrolase family protein [Candidatus Kapabacteria bacterium]|nr:fumarylacetoacetate hydrolase family protein [Ignavibacteriota bacterium]MCW5884006.1 fumarylacetoacetate hydrolase family protein [Candidatus Kapabacteria bacterium]
MSYKKYSIQGESDIEVGTIYCIGQNYSKHAAEMGSSVSPEPVIFIKPPAAYIQSGENVVLPDFSENVHYEVELVVLIGNDCHNILPEDAHKYIGGYAVGIDVTLRDLQKKAKEEGKPWSVAKGFYTSAPVSGFIPQSRFENEVPYFDLKLWVNDELKQSGSTKEMERTVAELIQYISKVFSLRKGDVIFTGTPEGVGQIRKGDIIKAELSGYVELSVGVV